jgi:hypothetical protein
MNSAERDLLAVVLLIAVVQFYPVTSQPSFGV